MEANSTGGQDSRRAVAPSDDDDDDVYVCVRARALILLGLILEILYLRTRKVYDGGEKYVQLIF